MYRRLLLISLAAVLMLAASCSDNQALKGRYQAEKMFFEAEKAARVSSIRPDLNTPEMLAQIEQQYQATLDFCYQTLESVSAEAYPKEYAELSELTFKAGTRVSQFSYAREDYEKCIRLLSALNDGLPLEGNAEISVNLNLGRAYQSAGKWDSALALYNYSLERFYPPVDARGEIILNLFNLPNHIYDVLSTTGDSTAARGQVDRAESYYRGLIEEHPGEALEGACHLTLASLYERIGRFDDAVAELSYLIDTTDQLSTSAKLRIAQLQAQQLNRPELAIEQYDEILSRLTGRDTLHLPNILYNKGLVYLHQGDYREARQVLLDVKNRYPRFFHNMPTVQFGIARSWELEDSWERAETEYKFLINNFSSSEQALSTYLYLVQEYSERGRTIEAKRMEERAETVYDELAATRSGSAAEAIALSYKAELYRRRGDWPQTVKLLTTVFDKFPTSEVGFRAMISAALIYRDQLGDQASSDAMISELKRRLTTIDEKPQI